MVPFDKQQQRKKLKRSRIWTAMHSHLDCNYPFNFFYVTVLFVMNILPGYYRNWPRVGLLVSSDLTGRASPMLISRCWFSTYVFRYV